MAIEFLGDKRVQGLRANGKRLEIRDAKVRGLVIRVTEGRPLRGSDHCDLQATDKDRATREAKERREAAQRAVKTWSVVYRVKGSRRKQRLTLGRYPVVSVAQARQMAQDVIREAAQGRDPAAEARSRRTSAKRESLTFADLLEEYVDRRKGVRSIPEVARELRKDVLPHVGSKKPPMITAADVDVMSQAILARGSPCMARRLIENLKALFNYCLCDASELAERYEITCNPAERLGRRRRGAVSILAPRPRQRVRTDAEIAAWLKALEVSGMCHERALAL